MTKLTVFYDPDCGLCGGFRRWLLAKALWVNVDFVGFNTAKATKIFPGLKDLEAEKECVVLADDGRWWQGGDAWLVCLWATREFRPLSHRLADPLFRPVLLNVVHLISGNRLTLSRLLRLKSDEALRDRLREHQPDCVDGRCSMIPALEKAKTHTTAH